MSDRRRSLEVQIARDSSAIAVPRVVRCIILGLLVTWSALEATVTTAGADGHGFTGKDTGLAPGSGFWRFEEGIPDETAEGDEVILDSSGSNVPGTPMGGPVYRSDVAVTSIPRTGEGNALSLAFDGSDDRVFFSSMFPFHEQGDVTMEFWLKFTPNGHRSLFWTRGNSSDTNRFHFYLNGNGTLGFDYRTPSRSRHGLLGGSTSGLPVPNPTSWTHIAIVRKENVYTIYFDGDSVWSRSDPSPDLPTAKGWQIAGRDDRRFIGSIDELRISNRALSPDEFLISASAESTFVYPGPFPDRRYFLLTVPVELSSTRRLNEVFEPLGSPGDYTWRGFGIREGKYIENPEAVPGRGFWLAVAARVGGISIDGSPIVENSEVALEEGWNIVGVPSLAETLSWGSASIRVDESEFSIGAAIDSGLVADRIWWYEDTTPDLKNNGDVVDSTWYVAHTLLNPWGGYFVYAETACVLRFPEEAWTTTRRVGANGAPGTTTPAGASSSLDRSRPEWTIDLEVSADGSRDGPVSVGVLGGSISGYDPTDVYKPPIPNGKVRLSIIQPEAAWREFMRAYAPPSSGRCEWIIEVSGVGESASLSWSGVEALPSGKHAYLIDPRSGVAVDMRRASEHSFLLDGTARTFRLLVQDDEITGTLLGSAGLSLELLGPNPLRGTVEISFSVRVAGHVRLDVYDVVGRRVATLFNDRVDRGDYTAQWSRTGLASTGNTDAASGIYFVRLATRGGAVSRKIVLIE